MLDLIRRDEALHTPLVWLAKSTAAGGALLGYFAWRRYALGSPESALQQLLAVLWVLLGIYLLLGRVRTRCGPLDLALPVPARRIWLSHVAAVLLSTAPMLAITLGLMALLQWALLDVSGVPLHEPTLVAALAHVVAGLVLAVVALESLQLELVAAPGGWRAGGLRLAVLALVATLSVTLAAFPLPVVAVPLGLAAALAIWTLGRLPESFSLAPRKAPAGDRPGSRERTAAEPAWAGPAIDLSPWRLVSRLFLCIHGARFGAATPWIGYPWVVLMGAVAGGLLTGWGELEDLRFLYIPLYAFMLLAPVPTAVEQLSLLDPLPIGRRVLFALVTLPSVAFFLVGYGAGQVGLGMLRDPVELVDYRRAAGDGPYCICVPAGRHEIAWDGRSPTIASSWGESHPVSGTPLFRGSRIRLYSPYHAPQESSPEFVALQLSRAVEAVYGRHIPPDEIRKRYLRIEGDEVTLEGDRLTLRADYPDLRPRGKGPLLPFFLAATTVPFLLLTALLVRTYRATLSRRWSKLVWIGAVVMAVGLVLAQTALAIADLIEPSASRGFLEILLRERGESVTGSLGTWIVSILLLLTSYRLAESLLLRAELPVKPEGPGPTGGATNGA